MWDAWWYKAKQRALAHPTAGLHRRRTGARLLDIHLCQPGRILHFALFDDGQGRDTWRVVEDWREQFPAETAVSA